MLDFQKLMRQIDFVGQETLENRESAAKVMEEAQRAYKQASQNATGFAERLEENIPWAFWPIALPLEEFGKTFALPEPKEATVVAVDGSQIMPSHHEIHSCFLLNIGCVQISYGAKVPPLLESFPYLYHKSEDLYPLVDRRRIHIDELYVSLERNLLELSFLADRAILAKEIALPVVALIDGSLIPWSLERMPDAYQNHYIERHSEIMQALKDNQVPVIGYISHSRSSELVNALRISICPYELSNCREFCYRLNEEDFPCSKIWPLLDRTILKGHLPIKHRSCASISGTSASKLFAFDFRTCFLYLNNGEEIARLEFPRWLFDHHDILDTAISTILSQADKGKGYPIALSEAHHLAVIKGNDRQHFFDLLTKHLIAKGAGPVKPSPKEAKKRIGLV
jgi:NurA domain